MARKIQSEITTPRASAQEPPRQAATETPTSPGEEANGDRRRPGMSWRLSSDRTTSIEVAAWLNTHRTQGGEEYEQVTFTVQRSYKTDDGWQKGGSWRTHDLPVLTFMIQQAHGWAIARRMTVADSSIPF